MKRDYVQEAIGWCILQKIRWAYDKDKIDPFKDGVSSGYGWMKDHLEHIKKKGRKCRCPR